MKVLVTGSTGFVGRHLVPVLLARGHAVRCLVRPTSDRSVLPEEVEWALGDVEEPESLRRSVEGVEAVVHLVAILREGRTTFEAVIVQGTQNVVTACREAGLPLVHLGALGTTLDSPSRYGRSVAQGVRLVRESGLPVTVLRPSIIVGAGGNFTERFADLVRRYRKVPVVGSGENEIQPIHISDVVEAIAVALEAPKQGEVRTLVGPERVTWNAFVRRMATAMGLARSVRHVSPALVRLASRAGTLVGRPPLVTQDELHYLQEDLVGDPGEFVALLGRPPLDLDRGLRDAVGHEGVRPGEAAPA